MTDTGGVWDEGVVAMLKDLGGDELVGQLVAFWQEQQLGDDVPRLRAALTSGDMTTVVSASHRIKGAAVQLGLTQVHRVVERIHTAARAGDLAGARRAAEPLDEAVNTSSRVLGLTS